LLNHTLFFAETDVQKCDAAVKEESELEVCELLPSDDLFYPINNRGYDLDVPCLLGERATEGEYSGGEGHFVKFSLRWGHYISYYFISNSCIFLYHVYK